ncbi:MAG TPA: tetratricopeptide repeat protein [Phycisphaerae bacterium]|nr:tetratricopeptide repeat protein [Phycisphaerae bacterium]HRY69153.1 tetratricopeptide repeat protein [Phycisphaerae bacterium]HSA26114.1 tetratricopeptide repeat protein [Phycisphaerae bacterium]
MRHTVVQTKTGLGFGGLVFLGSVVGVLTGCAPDLKDLREAGIEQFRNQQYVESTATLREALEIKRTDPQINYYMGLNYRAMAARKFRDGDVASACRELDTSVLYFSEAVKSWPNYMAAIDAKTEALEARGKYDQALTVAKDVTDTNRGHWEHYVVLGNQYRDRGEYDEALRVYKLALTTNPRAARAYSELGRLYIRTGDRAMAFDSLRKAYELNHNEPGVASQLAMLEVDEGVRAVAGESVPPRGGTPQQ